MQNRHLGRRSRKKSADIFSMLRSKTILLALVTIFAFLLLLRFKSLIVFVVIAAAAALINYFIHVSNLHIHLGHVSFLAVIFSYTLGFRYGIFMVIIAHVLAEVMAGHADAEMIITGSVYIVNCLIASLLTGADIVALGLGLTLFQGVATFVLGLGAGTPIAELITEDGVEFLMLIFYYVTFARPLVSLVG